MEFTSHSLEETESLAQRIAKNIVAGDNIGLSGPLGAGKTSLARYLLHAWGYRGLITSPTFTLVNEYPIKLGGEELLLVHADVYRLEQYQDVFELGLEESMANVSQIVLIEWVDIFPELTSKTNKTISLTIAGDDKRKIRLTGFTAFSSHS